MVGSSGSADLKIEEWPEEDHCFVGSAPGLILGGCHGRDERQFLRSCAIVDEAVDPNRQDGKPLPPETSGRDLANSLHSPSGA